MAASRWSLLINGDDRYLDIVYWFEFLEFDWICEIKIKSQSQKKSIRNKNLKHSKHSLANSLYQDTVDLNDREAKMAVTCQSVASRWSLLIHDDDRNLEIVYWFEFWEFEWICEIEIKSQNWKNQFWIKI